MSKVLIIEDDPPYRKIYTRKFEVSGFEVQAAENGKVGLDTMRVYKPDIVFVDLMMPQIDGFQFLAEVKADDTLNSTPVVVLTNLSTSDDAQKVLEQGAVAILVKSDTEPNQVVEKAREVLGEKPADSTPAAEAPEE